MSRRVLYILSGLLAVGVAAAALVAACTSRRDSSAESRGTPTPGAAPASSASARPTVSAVPITPASSTPHVPTAHPPTPGGTKGPGAAPACAASDLELAQLPGDEGAAGTVLVSIGLTNRSGRACSINGYPQFTLAASAGDQQVSIQHGGLGMATFQMKPAPVRVDPSGRAGFLLAYLNRPTDTNGSCAAATKMTLRIGAARVTGPVQISVCGEPMKVSPYVPAEKLVTS